MGELVFPELHFEHSYEKENETLYKNFGDAAIFTSPTSVDIFPRDKFLKINLNGQGHHFQSNIPVTFTHDKYEKIYESLKKRESHLYPGIVKFEIRPETFRPKGPNIDEWTREELIEFIKKGLTIEKDRGLYFNDDTMENVTYVPCPNFMVDGKLYRCTDYTGYDMKIRFKTGIEGIIFKNRDIINETIRLYKLTHIYKLTTETHYLTEELTAYKFYLTGFVVK